MSDPWTIQKKGDNDKKFSIESEETLSPVATHPKTILEFEDNFSLTPSTTNNRAENSNGHEPLPDSLTYLEGLEQKLQKLKKSTKLVEALVEKRQDCLRAFLEAEDSEVFATDFVQNHNAIFELDTPVNNIDSTVQEIFRHLKPAQPLTVGETVPLTDYDQLEEQRQEEIEALPEESTTPESR